jgi:hypothetical protein
VRFVFDNRVETAGEGVAFEFAGGGDSWREIDAKLRSFAAQRAALDEEEARWLVAARRAELHRRFGFATLLEYLERILGYGPHAARERLRVAEALEALPQIRAALGDGRLNFSAVRELTRVASPETEAEWLEISEGKTLRELEPIIAGRRPGDLPGDPPPPGAIRHAVRFEVSGATLALLRDARIALDSVTDERLDDDALVAGMCRAVLDGPRDADQGRARHQIATTVCETCDRAWQDGGGVPIEIAPNDLEIARCDAQHLGSVDAETPARATQDIPPAVRRLVWRRDHGCCFVPGCRSAQHLDVHHIHWRSHGGDHTPDNLAVCCGAHHQAIHEGRLIVTGKVSTGLAFAHDDGRPYGAPPAATLAADAIGALVRLDFTVAEARAAVKIAASHVGPAAPVLELIRAALKATRPPS